jgi:nitrate/TMAO reductase-like tetraheme cytochrome c subunit
MGPIFSTGGLVFIFCAIGFIGWCAIEVILWLTSFEDYQVLARNFAQIRQKLQETNNLLEEYKKYYEGTEEKKDVDVQN